MENINNEVYSVAQALGTPLNAPRGSACYLASYYIDEDSETIFPLGAYATEEEAKVALINSRCGVLMDWEYDAPWNTDLNEAEYELTGDLSFARFQQWVSQRSLDKILTEIFNSELDYFIDKVVVAQPKPLGDLSYSISY